VRGEKVVAYTRRFLDEHFPLANGSHADATGYSIDNGQLTVALGDASSALKDPTQLKGYNGNTDSPDNILLGKNNLHADLCFDASHPMIAPTPHRMAAHSHYPGAVCCWSETLARNWR